MRYMISILHLSDLHIVECADWHNMRACILEEAANVRNRRDVETLLIITGDFHNFSDADYANAEIFVREVIAAMGIDVKKDVFVVPGNHDVGSPAAMDNFFHNDPDWKLRQESSVRNLKELNPTDPKYKPYFTWRLESYIPYKNFVTRLGIYEENDEPAAVHVRCWRDTLNILHLNTTLVADGTEKHNQRVDISRATDDSIWAQFPSDLPAIALGHNHFYDLNNEHQDKLLGPFYRHNVCAYLCGDTHEENINPNMQRIRLESGYSEDHPSIPNIVCVKGAADDSDSFSDFGFYWHEWDKTTNQVTLRLRNWKRSNSAVLEDGMIQKDAYYMPRKEPNTTQKGISTTENISLDDSILRINQEYIHKYLITDAEEAEKTKAIFYNYSQVSEITFRMLINGLAIMNPEYERICQNVLSTARTTSLTFLTANGSMCKSVMLCAVALMAYKAKMDVFYLQKIPSSLPEINQQTLLLVDDALDYQEVVLKLYKKYNRDRRVHVVMTDRIHKINTLIDETLKEIPWWGWDSKAIVLNRSIHTININLPQKHNAEEISVSDDLIKVISDQVITHRAIEQGLQTDVSVSLRYTNKTVADVTSDYFVAYNRLAEKTADIRQYEWDWDIWDRIPELKGLFKYVAALYGCGVQVSIACIEKMRPGSSDALLRAKADGILPVIQIWDGFIRLRHDTIAENFFAITKISPYNSLMQLLENDWLDEDTVVRFEKRVFSLRNIKDTPPELKTYNVPKLLYKFSQNTNYRQILRKKQRIHSLELATIMQKNKNGGYDDKDALSQAIGTSFANVESAYRNKIQLWIKYFMFTVRTQTDLPEELLKCLNKDGLYMKITNIINKSFLQPQKLWYAANEMDYILSNSASVFKSIINDIDATDKPSRFMLSDIYLKQNRFSEAVAIIREIEAMHSLTDDEKYNCATKTLNLLKAERAHLKKRGSYNNRIPILDKQIIQMYNDWIYYMQTSNHYSEKYLELVRGYTSFLQTKGKFDDAYNLLKNTIEDFERQGACTALHRVYNAMGQLYQDSRYCKKNPDIAAHWFSKASICTARNKKEIMSSLKPMCKTKLDSGSYEECKTLCREMRMADQKDPEIFLLMLEAYRLQEIKEQGLSIGKEFDKKDEQWLNSATETEITAAVEIMLKNMTDKQRMYADEFGCNEKYRESPFLNDSYVIIHCISNNRAIPITLHTKWIIEWNRRNSLLKKYFRAEITEEAGVLAPSNSDG